MRYTTHPVVTRNLGRGVLVSLPVVDDLNSTITRQREHRRQATIGSTHTCSGDESHSVYGGISHRDTGGNLPDQVTRDLQVFGIRTFQMTEKVLVYIQDAYQCWIDR